MDELIVQSEISSRIYTIRGEQVMLDRDLAELYDVETKRLNEQVKRNIERFPDDFMFQLKENEKNDLVAKCDRLNKMKYSTVNPNVFTEQGIYMLSSVLKSKKAIEVNIAIIRTFKKLREFSKHYNALAKKIMEVERKNDKQYRELKKALDALILESEAAERKTIGFIKSE
ncbi:ORF6N domain-containing protein [Sulfurovum sp.]|uniref:ORF6N domain-containing protein n=1 Tax=Sulfurovum sp. TaxID=1969726 RepID=UPI0025E25D23|nr:ORF6N domain-containing protein [Sulfurovum sp.]